MELNKFERDIKTYYKNLEGASSCEKLLKHIKEEWRLDANELSFNELRVLVTTVLEEKTEHLHQDIENLLAQKEKIEREIERKSHEIQQSKYALFNDLETLISDEETLAKLHQIKLHDVDLYEVLEDLVESAIITTLEKNSNETQELIEEITKEITFETLNEGALSSIRIRKIISKILQTAIDVAEATPNMEEKILHGVIKGVRKGLIKSIKQFQKQLLYMPDELKHELINDTQDIESELVYTDTLFNSVITNLINSSTPTSAKVLEKVSTEINYEANELLTISKETAEVMSERMQHLRQEAIKRSSEMLKSETAQEAKRLGIHAFKVAKAAINGAVKSAKDAIETEKQEKK